MYIPTEFELGVNAADRQGNRGNLIRSVLVRRKF